MSKQFHVFGGFKTTEGARVAAERLEKAGVPKDSISILMSEEARRDLATVERHTKAPEGAATGGIIGGAFGALIAGLTSVAAIAIPGVGLLGAGPLVAAVAGVGAGGAAGAAIGGLTGLGMSEHEVKLYTNMLASHGVLVVVSTTDKTVRTLAKKTLDDAGAVSLETSKGVTAHL